MMDARDEGRISADKHACKDFTNVTFVFKDDKTIGAYSYVWKLFSANRNETGIKAGKGETTCLLDVAGEDSVKASDQVPVEGKKVESPAPEPFLKAG